MELTSFFIILVVTLVLGFILPSNSFASTETSNKTENEEKEKLLKELQDDGLISKNINPKLVESIEEISGPKEHTIQHFLSGNEPTYTYWLQTGNAKDSKTTYGKWKNKGGAFHGLGTFKKTESSTSSFSVSGGIPKTSIKGSLGKQTKITTTASRKIPKGKKGQSQVRNVYKHYKVTMREWISIDGRKKATNKKKTVTVKKKKGLESRIVLK
ncbi:hypothetical protein JNUCC74_06375 [Cerasibacillus sp. JNUCC 74]